MLISAWLTAVRNRLQSPRLTKRRSNSKPAANSSENLEARTLLTAPTLVAIRPNVGDILLEGNTRNVAPRELTLQFNPGQVIDVATVTAGIEIWRGGSDKIINNVGGVGNDVPVTIGYVGIGDHPEEVVVRFAENLPDDVYRITIKGAGPNPLRNSLAEAFNGGVDLQRNFNLDLGAVVEGVVPQPVLRNKTITIANVAQLRDADKLTITVGGQKKVFEFHDTTRSTVVTGDYQVNFTPGTSTATSVATSLAAQITAASMGVAATQAGSNVTLIGSVFTPNVVKTVNIATSLLVNDAGLVQRRDTVIVYFNKDALNPVSAQKPEFYRLYNTGGTLSTADDVLLQPTTVTYDAASNTSVLKFSADLPTATYALKIGSNTELTDTLVDAINLGALSAPIQWSGTIGDNDRGPNDVDLYRFTLSGPQTVSFTATPSPATDVALRLFDSSGVQLTLQNATGVGVAETLTSASLPAGTYYLGVSSSGNVTYTPADGLGAAGGTTTGQYTLTSGVVVISDANSSFATANQVGVLGATERIINAAITPQSIALPAYPGGVDEPSHRDIPIVPSENRVGSSGTASTVPGGIFVQQYFFGNVYGQDPQGNNLFNNITENQKQRAREILELWSKKSGIIVRETSNTGLQIVTGDLRAFGPNVPPNAAAGMANGSLAVMNGNINWGSSEYGGAWFNTAMHEIGHSLGLRHAYDSISVMGAGEDPTAPPLIREPIYPTDIDQVSIQRIRRPDATDIDMYQFQLTQAGSFSAEIVAERSVSNLDSVLRLYDGNRKLIAQNDNYYSGDSFIGLNLPAGTYYLGVSSTGNADYDPTIADSGFGGTTDGTYQLKLKFDPAASNKLVDSTGTEFDGNGDGVAGGQYEFWFKSGATVFVDKAAAAGGNGNISTPYSTIAAAITFAKTAPGTIVRVVGNGGTDGDELTPIDAKPYLIGPGLADGSTLDVPKDVTLMIDADAVIKLLDANIDAGTSAQGNDRSNGAIQVLGVPNRSVFLTSYRNDLLGGDSDGVSPAPTGGNWGGVVFRDDSDYESAGIFLNYVNKANITYGGGQVFVNSVLSVFSPIHMDTARPTITFNTITNSASAAVSANPNSFDDSLNRIGPEIHGNILTNNSVNGLFIRVRTQLGRPLDTLDVSARFDDTDIVHVITENVVITGNAGGSLNGVARLSGRLAIDAGTVVKLGGSRIETLVGNANVIAEGTPERRIIFTSILDDQFGVGGTFDTTNNQLMDTAAAGNWGGLVFNATSNGSLDHVVLRYGGGKTPIEGDFNEFNVIEAHQANLRLTNSRLEFNASGIGPAGASATRNGRGDNSAATVFIRGAQPIIVGNEFRDNSSVGSFIISIDVNSLHSFERPDVGRSRGPIQRFTQFDDNLGALVRNNRMRNNGRNGMEVRGGTLTTQVVWDDTDIVHVLQTEVYDPNLHTFGGIRLQSGLTESLIVKLLGNTAGFTAGGVQQEIDDRIGGTVQIIGTPGFPVILTSLHDDSVGAGFDLEGFPVRDTNNNGGATTAAPGDWRSVLLTQYSNDRNVRIVNETELAYTAGQDANSTSSLAQLLGTLASRQLPAVIPNTASATELLGSLDKVGDDNRPVGFEVHGRISPDTPSDVDVYSFKATAGSEIWIDLDRTTSRLDSVLELISSTDVVLAGSSAGVLTGLALPLVKDVSLGGDYYTQNYMDEAFRVILPGATGVEGTYFVRVRSESGLTSGAYQLQIRVNQRDEAPGSTVRFADIRFATNGIEMYGLNAHSPLSGEAGEGSGDNNSFDGSEFIGDLLSSDRNTISVRGSLSSANDIDWYSFSVDYQFIQAIPLINSGGKTWATIFDIDYADGLARPDTILSVYDQTGRLMYVSRDSDIIDDQPAPGAGQDVDDLSRGSVGKLDPYIGTVQLPEANDRRYFVAISSNGRMPAELAQTFISNPSDQLSRLEPVNSLRRIIEDHIGFQGYSTNGLFGPVPINPSNTQGLFNITNAINLDTHVKPFTLADVSLFSATGGTLSIRNPFTGGPVVNAINSADFDDIAVRPDGVLYGTINNADALRIIDPSSGGQSGGGASNIPMASGTPDFGGMAFRLAPEVISGTYELFVANNSNWNADGDANTGPGGNEAGPALWRLDPTSGNRIDDSPAAGLQNVGALPAGVTITGLAFASMQSSVLFAVDSTGGLWRTTVSGTQTYRSIGGWTQISITGGSGPAGFTGITLGPQNVEDAAYAQILFASGSNGRLYAFDQTGLLQTIFDTNADGVADDFSAAYQSGTRGLAFSPLDFNLWHPTLRRRADAGHGINNALDNSRDTSANRAVVGRSTTEAEGGASFYFGLEQWQQTPGTADAYYQYNGGASGQLGVLNGQAQRELTTNAAIANTYNLIGGASGSLVTNGFSLQGYTATERPVLYFNYFLATDGTNAANNTMRDAARVYVSTNGGASWNLVATNNSTRNTLTSELPAYASHSATQTPQDSRQLVQELFDNTGTWRQARVDLGGFAGQANLQLRFDFTTSGKMNDTTVDSLGFGNFADSTRSGANSFEGFYVDDIIVGLANRGEMATTSATGNLGGAFYSAPADPSGNTQQLQGEYQLEIRRGTEFASTISALGPEIGVASSLLITGKQRLVSGWSLTVPTASVIQDGDTYTISNGIESRTFEFELGGGVTSPNIAVVVNSGMTKGQVSNALAAAINSQSGLSFNADPVTWFNVLATTRPAARNSDIVDLTGAYDVTATPIAAPETLTVNMVPTTISEAGGNQTFTVSRSGPTTAALNVTVSVSAPSGAATTQATIVGGPTFTFAIGVSTITVTLAPVDDGVRDGTQAVLLRATAAGFNSISDIVDITDDEVGQIPGAFVDPLSAGAFGSLRLTLLRNNFSETDGNKAVTGYVTLPDPLNPGDLDAYDNANSLLVSITSSDGSAITSTSTVFVDGQMRAYFAMDIIDKYFASGSSVVTLYVTAPGYTSTSGTVTINESPNVTYAQRLGDKNLERHQGMVIIESNTIRNASGYGIIADAAPRIAGNQTLPGSVRNLAVLNASRLIPGVTIRNNVVANLGTGGIQFGGDINAGADPLAPVPFGKIVNNTIYGGANPTGIGIRVEQNASPTLLNNVIVNTVIGVSIDASSSSTVVGSSLFYGNTANGTTGSDAIFPPVPTQIFVDPLTNNYYPAPGSPVIDSALNSLGDRPSFVAVKNPLGIPNSDLLAPDKDLFGQLRVDDPGVATPPGLGSNIFKDRGAIERADFAGPFAQFVVPADDNGSLDLDSGLTRIHVDNLQFPTTLAIDLLDAGIGVDDLRVNSSQFQLSQNGVLLVENVDYRWRYNPTANRVFFISVTTFPTDTRYSIAIDNAAVTGVQDLAGNRLAANQTDGTTVFTLLLTDGINDAPVHTVPPTQIIDEDVTLVFSAAGLNPIVVFDKDAYLGRPEATPTFTQDDGILTVTLTAVNGLLTLSRITGLDFTLGVGDGTDDPTMTFTGTIRDINAALNGLMFIPTPDYFGTGSVTIISEDLGNFGPPPLNPQTTSTTVDITINPVNDRPVFTLSSTPIVVNEDAGPQTIAGFMTGQAAGPANETPPQDFTVLVTVFSVNSAWTTSTFFASGGAPAIDKVTGNLTFTTAQDVNGTATIRVILTDDGTPSASSLPQTFVITVNPINDAPVFTPTTTDSRVDASGNITVLEDSGVQTINYVGTSAAARATALDEVGGQTPFTWSLSTATLVSGNLSFSQLSVNPTTGILTFNPAQDKAGSATVVLTLRDSGLGAATPPNVNSVTRTITINVTQVNDRPVAVTGNYNVDEGDSLILDASGSYDVDAFFGDTWTYEWDLDNNGSYETTTGASATTTVTWATLAGLGITAPSVRTIGLRVTDSSGASNNTGVTTATLTTQIVDYGDAPNTYGTLRANTGAAHTITGGLFLGTTVTKELDGQPSASANADSGDDGVTFPTSFERLASGQALPAYVDITASKAGKLDVWLDMNGNGVFDNATEHLNSGASYNVTAGVNRINFVIPAGSFTGDTFMRFRLSTAGTSLPTGRANDGEVEDYSVKIKSLQSPITPTINRPIDFNPSDGQIAKTTDLTPTVAWSLHDANFSYNLVVTNSASQIVFTSNGTTSNSVEVIPALAPFTLPPGIYTATVTAFNKINTSASPATWQFEVVPLSVSSPVGDVGTSRPVINWNHVEGSKTYRVVVESIATSSIVINQTITTASVVLPAIPNRFTPTNDLPLGQYRVRVQATDAADLPGDWSPYRLFAVKTAPVVTGPAASTSLLRPTVTWNSVAGAVSYKVTLTFFTDTGTAPVITNVTGTSWTPSADLKLGEYRVTVQAFSAPNATGESSFVSAVRTFFVKTAPVVTQPIGRVPDTTPTFSWSAVPGADRYELVVSKAWGDFAEVIHWSALTSTSFTQTSKLGLGPYTYQVRAINDASNTSASTVRSDFSPVRSFSIVEPPLLNGPQLTTFSNHPAVSWVAPPNSETFDIYYRLVGDSNPAFLLVNGVTGSSYTPNEKLFGIGTYIVWVRTYSNTDNPATPRLPNGTGDERVVSNWSLGRTFRVSTPPTILGPVDRSTVANPTLTWQSVPGALNYEIWINNDSVPVSKIYNVAGITALNYTVPANLPIGQYTFWVRARNQFGFNSNWSQPQKFSVVAWPTLTGPSSSTFITRPTFNWTNMTSTLLGRTAGAARYEFRLYAPDPVTKNFVELPQYTVTNLTTNSYTIPTDLPIGNYRAYVRGIANGRPTANVPETVSDFSFFLSFFVGGRPEVTTIPATTNTTPTLLWQAVDGASGYEVFLSTAASPNDNLLNALNNKTGGTSFVVPQALNKGVYRYWIRAFNASTGGAGLWSERKTLTIVDAGNPVTDELFVDPTEFVWTAVPGLVPQSMVTESAVSMLPAVVDGSQWLPLPEEMPVAEVNVSELLADNAAGIVLSVDDATITEQTDSVLSKWDEHTWWESQPVTEKSDGTDQKTLSAGFLGALFALAPRSIRRRRNEE